MEGKSRDEKDDGGTAVSPPDDDAMDTDRTGFLLICLLC